MVGPMPARPHVIEIDWIDPADAVAGVAARGRPILLDGGAAGDPTRARYSYVACDPGGWLEMDAGADAAADPFAAMEALLASHRAETHPDLPPFQGGLVGYLGYELGRRLERLPPPRPTGIALPDLAFGLYPTVAAFDHALGRAWIFGREWAAVHDLRDRLAAARETAGAQASTSDRSLIAGCWRAELTPAMHMQAVARIIEYIRAGDIYQANMTQRFLARLAPGVTALDAYRALRPRTGGPFSAFLDLGGGRAVASGSPERFLELRADGRIETRPIKGTRPRGADAAEDTRLAAELVASEKDRAENLMIVDLLRNDLSRVAEVGSVRVPTLWGLESYKAVHHLTSVVTARLRSGLGPVDLLRAAFPGGSITGAPKIRAMEIIHELEPARRGPYCGTVAWIGCDGAMDSSIVIRTLCIANGLVQAQAGGGIVADSDPADEYAESLVKARALLTALDPGMEWPPRAADPLELAAE